MNSIETSISFKTDFRLENINLPSTPIRTQLTEEEKSDDESYRAAFFRLYTPWTHLFYLVQCRCTLEDWNPPVTM
jgi:hypothetical protein